MPKSPKRIKSWVIYLWRNGDRMEGASPVATRDGIKEIYCHGWEIEKDPEAKKNTKETMEWRAKIKVKNLLNNTLNVLNWYGKKVLDEKGDISTQKLREMEAKMAVQAYKQAQTTTLDVQIDDLFPIKKFPTEDITLEQATEYGFKGDLSNPRTSGLKYG